ncbi:adenosine receptor A3-like [Clytia hemisphaerica]|uniref:adenosine receptor A3-like n=1 Tax=Clytia hemisphaerica TaxID=252671 RepID=UPI0034D5F24A
MVEYRKTPYPRFHMTDYHRITLVTYNLLINGILTLSLNLFIVVGLIKTQQARKNKSIQLVFLLSISDIVGAISVSSLVTPLLTTHSDAIYLPLELVTLFLLVITGHLHCFIIVLIAYDRFYCVKQPIKHRSAKFSRKTTISLYIILAISLFDGFLFVIATVYKFTSVSNLIVLAFDLIIFGFSIKCSVSFTKTLIKNRKNRLSGMSEPPSSNKDQYLVRIAKRFLISMLSLTSFYLISIFVNLFFHKTATETVQGHLEFLLFMGIFAIHTNASLNAGIFIHGNRKLRNLLKRRLDIRRNSSANSSEMKKTLQILRLQTRVTNSASSTDAVDDGAALGIRRIQVTEIKGR